MACRRSRTPSPRRAGARAARGATRGARAARAEQPRRSAAAARHGRRRAARGLARVKRISRATRLGHPRRCCHQYSLRMNAAEPPAFFVSEHSGCGGDLFQRRSSATANGGAGSSLDGHASNVKLSFEVPITHEARNTASVRSILMADLLDNPESGPVWAPTHPALCASEHPRARAFLATMMDHHYSGSSIPSMRDNPVPNVGGTHVIIGDEKPLKMAPPPRRGPRLVPHEAPSRSPVSARHAGLPPSGGGFLARRPRRDPRRARARDRARRARPRGRPLVGRAAAGRARPDGRDPHGAGAARARSRPAPRPRGARAARRDARP